MSFRVRQLCRWLIACCALAATSARADYVHILCDHESFSARALLIEGAHCKVDAVYYNIEGDRAGRAFLCLLKQAAQRGVQVRLLVDGLQNDIPGEVRQEIVAAGVELREYHPLLLHRPDWINSRIHDKLLIIDEWHMIVGSRNISDESFHAAPCRNYVERDAYVYGCAANAAYYYFVKRWESQQVRPAKLRHIYWDDIFGKDDDHHQGYIFTVPLESPIMPSLSDPPPAPEMADAQRAVVREASARQVENDAEPLNWVTVQFLCDAPDVPKYVVGGIQYDVLGVLERARCEILIESPYLAFSNKMLRILFDARERGVRVVLLTNSAQSTDQKLAQAAFENQKRQLLAAGIEIWEFGENNILHAKSAVVDDFYGFIGSYNFDARSEKSNSEVAIRIDDPLEAMYLKQSIHEHMARSRRIGTDGKPVGYDERYPETKAIKKTAIHSLRLVTPFIKRLL